MNESQTTRRSFIKLGGMALAIIPIMAVTGRADAATNAAMRTALKYQDKPNGASSCSNCAQFIPGKTAKDLGGCKMMVNDTEISPNGYCVGWTKKA